MFKLISGVYKNIIGYYFRSTRLTNVKKSGSNKGYCAGGHNTNCRTTLENNVALSSKVRFWPNYLEHVLRR